MNKPIIVAIYSGISKSTTFIERLIEGLTDENIQVLIFGNDNGKKNRLKTVKYYTYSHKINKLFRLLKYTLLVSLFNSKEKKKLDTIIALNKEESKQLLRLKYYPVLYHKPNIFHLQWTKSLKDWYWVQDFGIKLVVSLRGTHITISPKIDEYWKNLYLKLFPKVSAFHTVSKSTAIEAENHQVDTSRIHIIKSGLLLENFSFQLKKLIHEPLNVISVGRPHFAKGYTYALDAMYLLKKKNIPFHYTIVGVSKNEQLIHQRDQLELNEFVKFKTTISSDNVKEQIRESDVLLLPSIEEGIANVVLEAMALGTLVISTDCGGMEEVIVNEENGFLIPTFNVQTMARTLEKVSNLSLEDYNLMTKKARLVIEANHSKGKMISDMIMLYEKVLNGRI